MRIRIEIIDDLEDKTSMEFEGRLCKERLINFIEAYDFTIQESDEKIQVPRSRGSEIEELTIKGRMESFLKFDYHNDWFTSLDVKQAYDSMYEENINISTVSTYLSRMYRDGILDRRGSRNQRKYKIIMDDEPKSIQSEETTRNYSLGK